MCSYNISREISTLELLKQRFGESPLHFCEVMLKDVGDSKRINNLLISSVENIDSELEIQAMVISSEFWPTFREENFQIPGFAKRKMDLYSMEYKQLKGMRKLDWKTGLGTIEIEVSYGEEVITMRVSPLRAVILHQFQNSSECSIDLLTQSVKAPPSVVKRNVGFWVSQGLLKEISSDVYRLMQEWNFDHKAAVKPVHDDDEFMMETDKDAMEAECQMYWNYIKHMLTNLGPLSLERIHSMLEIFGVQGHTKKKLAITYLRAFLNNKTLQQQICFENGSYSLCK
jgi:anaphase-promoting complex subunit 2